MAGSLSGGRAVDWRLAGWLVRIHIIVCRFCTKMHTEMDCSLYDFERWLIGVRWAGLGYLGAWVLAGAAGLSS